jgi:hypothetical protein
MRKTFFLLCALLLLNSLVFSQVQDKADVKEDLCISQDEMILFNLVNDLRKQNKLSVIPLSGSLCIVSKKHIENLNTWKPQAEGCNLNSWTAGPSWSACCSNKDPKGTRCMNEKPSEITGYAGKGYELVYWQEESASALEAFELWKQVQASREMILCKGKWQSKEWKAMGIGIGQGYAVLWMGDKSDKAMNIRICGADTLLQNYTPAIDAAETKIIPLIREPETAKKPAEPETAADDLFYIIVASFKLETQANERLLELQKSGYADAIIIKSADRYRISLGSFSSEAKAKARMKELKAEFSDCWLFRLHK